ncbi:hypothetical protein [Streptomyces sp. NPDC048663]|uniref:hypothetical protein n=1 Tax=Streptomyces sp. NPDC048663 TaxID=3155638 RepID=UPI0034414480
MIFINPTDAPVGVEGLDYVQWTYPASRVTVRILLRTLGSHPRRHALTAKDLVHVRYGVTSMWREALMATPVIGALEAQHAAVHGFDEGVDYFAKAIGIPAAQTAGWREAVSNALLGDWTHLITRGGDPFFIPRHLKREARRAHEQHQPLWERKVNGRRVSPLEAPIAEGLTLRDLVSDCGDAEAALPVSPEDDPRLSRVLGALDPGEREVALAWGHLEVRTWADAAHHAGSADPKRFGEHVRRKIRRIAARYAERADNAARAKAATAGTCE